MNAWTPEELEEHLRSKDKVFLKLWKKGCGICKLSVPATERLEAANPYGLVFAGINVDEYPEMIEIAGTDSMPAFFVFADAEIKGKYLGFKGLDSLQTFVDESFSKKVQP